jgi:phosphoribosyl 1,2-cyclic phosphodiesterase
LGSGSGGNATLVATERTRVLVDAGLSRRETFRRLKSIGESPESLDAILISHEHTDHIAGMLSLAGTLGIPVYLTALTQRAIPLQGDGGNGADPLELEKPPRPPRFETFRSGQRFAVGDLEIEPFTVPHDAADPVAYCFSANGVRVGVCIDLGYLPDSVKVHLRGCHCLVLESNHDLDMLKVGPYPWSVKQRVMSRTGHLSNDAVAEFLGRDYHPAERNPVLVLAHLSENNNHPEIARLSAAMALEARRDCASNHTRLVLSSQKSPTEVFHF